MSNKKEEKKIQELAVELISLLGEKEAKVEVESGDEGELTIKISCEDPSFLVGYKGKTLESLQILLKLMVFSNLKEWRIVLVNVNDYREKQKEQIEDLAQKAAAEVEASKRPAYLPPMSSFERRLIHLSLADHPEVLSESEGEGEERRVVVKPKDK